MAYTKQNFKDGQILKAEHLNKIEDGIAAVETNAVPTSRTVNGKALNSNITLSASDVGADRSGTASSAVSTHNTNTSAHADIREQISQLSSEKDNYLLKNQGSANVGKILVVGTDGNLTLTDMPEGGASGDVIGTLDESNNIMLSGNLADGTYTLKYENANGSVTDIGDLVVSSISDYVIITTLENCTSSGATAIRGNGTATVTIIANSGYALPDSITVSGASYTWDKSTGNIVLSNPTSDVYITVTALKTITNFIEYNADNTTDWSIWCNDARIGSDGSYRSSTGRNVTNYIAVQNGDIVHWYDMPINGAVIGLYNANKTHIAANNLGDHVNAGRLSNATTLGATVYDGQFTIANANIAYIRFTIVRDGYTSIFNDDDGIVNIERNGEYL